MNGDGASEAAYEGLRETLEERERQLAMIGQACLQDREIMGAMSSALADASIIMAAISASRRLSTEEEKVVDAFLDNVNAIAASMPS